MRTTLYDSLAVDVFKLLAWLCSLISITLQEQILLCIFLAFIVYIPSIFIPIQSQPAIARSELTVDTLEQSVKYV